MPLLSLPCELLLDIIRSALEDPAAPDPATCCFTARDFDRTLLARPCTPQNATPLAHTCRLLRDLTLPFMYASVAANIGSTSALGELLTSCPHIAGSVHHLTLMMSDAPGSVSRQRILSSCAALQDLRLNWTFERTRDASFDATLLEQLRPHLHLALGFRSAQWINILQYLTQLSSTLFEVHTLRIEDPRSYRVRLPIPADMPIVPPAPITSVTTFICHSGFYDHFPPLAGDAMAHMLPNVQVLDLHTGPFHAVDLLKTYAELGTPVRDLMLHSGPISTAGCATIAKLAPRLRRYTAHGETVCHEMFEADWACVDVLEVDGWICQHVKAQELRDQLVRLIHARPGASIQVVVNDDVELVMWEGGTGRVAPIEAFLDLEDE